MATYSDLKLHHRVFTANYPFSRYAVADNPSAMLRKPLNECRIALITTAGLRLESDRPFENSLGLGDPSFRVIPGDVDMATLIEDHKSTSFDHAGIEADPNIALPIDRFREMVESGKIGSINHRHLSFMGSIISPSKLINETAPAAARMLKEDGVDAVVLVPV